MDADGFIYFAGRDAEWLRVGGENFLARPIEEALARHPDVLLASVYGVPDPEAGDQVMAAIALQGDAAVRSRRVRDRFSTAPTCRRAGVRPSCASRAELPATHTNKILKRALRREKFLVDRVADPIYWRPRGAAQFTRFTLDDLAALRERFRARGLCAIDSRNERPPNGDTGHKGHGMPCPVTSGSPHDRSHDPARPRLRADQDRRAHRHGHGHEGRLPRRLRFAFDEALRGEA